MRCRPALPLAGALALFTLLLVATAPPAAAVPSVGYVVCEVTYRVNEATKRVTETSRYLEATVTTAGGVARNTVDDARVAAGGAVEHGRGAVADTATQASKAGRDAANEAADWVDVASDHAATAVRNAGDAAYALGTFTVNLVENARRTADPALKSGYPIAGGLGVAPVWTSLRSAMRAHDVESDAAGNILLAGEARTPWWAYETAVVKHSPVGATLWSVTLPPGVTGNGVAATPDGGAIVTGWSAVGPGGTQVFTARLGPTGSVLWARQAIVGVYNYGEDVAVGPDGAVYVAGFALNAGGTPNSFIVVKYDALGTLLWRASHHAGYESNGIDIALDPLGNPAVAGWTYDASTNGALVVKFDRLSGRALWSTEWRSATPARANAIDYDAAGNVHVVGTSRGDVLHLKIADVGSLTPGRILLAHRYDLGGFEEAHALAVDGAGGFVAAGEGSANGSGEDFVILRADLDGNLIWSTRRDFGGNEGAEGLALTPAGLIVATGTLSDGSAATVAYADALAPAWLATGAANAIV